MNQTIKSIGKAVIVKVIYIVKTEGGRDIYNLTIEDYYDLIAIIETDDIVYNFVFNFVNAVVVMCNSDNKLNMYCEMLEFLNNNSLARSNGASGFDLSTLRNLSFDTILMKVIKDYLDAIGFAAFLNQIKDEFLGRQNDDDDIESEGDDSDINW